MLKALYDYAGREGLTLPAGYVNKTLKAFISLASDGSFIGIELPDSEAVPCPDIGSLARSVDKCNVLAEKLSVVVPGQPNAKSEFFMQTLESLGELEPMAETCRRALKDPTTLEAISAEAERNKLKAGDRVSFRVDGRKLLESERLPEWWGSLRRELTKRTEYEPMVRCLITGELTHPLATAPPVSGLRIVGGHAGGDALICFDKNAFCSYNLKQAANAPVSEEAYAAVKAALDHLLAKAPPLAGMKFVHWYDASVPPEDDMLLEEFMDFGPPVEDEETEIEAEEPDVAAIERQADELIRSPHSGAAPPKLAHKYYIAMLSGVGGRVMIRRYQQGSYAELQQNIELWREDLELINRAGSGTVRPCKLSRRLMRLMKPQKRDKKIFERMAKELAGITPAVLTAIIGAGQIPDAAASRALAYIRSMMLRGEEYEGTVPVPDDLACQWLKVWLIRKNRARNCKEELMAKYNVRHSNPAYHCGAMMAVYANIQRTAMPEVNAGIVQRYYAAASQTPALVFGQLERLSTYHMEKIDSQWYKKLYFEYLEKAAVAVGDWIPATLSLEGQAYFALGYRQMWAEIRGAVAERKGKYKEMQAAENAGKGE